MLRGGTGHVAEQFELLAAVNGGQFSGKSLFVIVGAPGVWRKVPNPGVTDATDRGIVTANFGSAKIHLMYDAAINAELAQAGFTHAAVVNCPPEFAAVIDRAKELAASPPATLLTAAGDDLGGGSGGPASPHKRRGRPKATGTAAAPAYTMPLTEADGSPREGSIIAPVAIDHMTTPPPQSVAREAPAAVESAAGPPPATGFEQVNEMEI